MLPDLFYRHAGCLPGTGSGFVGVARGGSENATVESRYVVPPFSVKVSESRTGRGASIL